MKHEIKFSIITCTYQAAEVVERTLRSVASQDYPHLEHLIIDGASKDNTLSIVKQYSSPILRLVSEPDKGLYDAMNKGIQLAQGDYLLFLNAGDVFPTADTLSLICQEIKNHESLPAVLYGDTDIVDNNGVFLRHRRLSPPEQLSWRSFRHGMLVCHQAFYVRTDIARRTPYNLGFRFSADIDWCIRVMKEADREGSSLLRIPHVVANYLDGGMSVKNHRASLKERFRIMSHHYGLLSTAAMHFWFVVRTVLKK